MTHLKPTQAIRTLKRAYAASPVTSAPPASPVTWRLQTRQSDYPFKTIAWEELKITPPVADGSLGDITHSSITTVTHTQRRRLKTQELRFISTSTSPHSLPLSLWYYVTANVAQRPLGGQRESGGAFKWHTKIELPHDYSDYLEIVTYTCRFFA